MPVARLEASGDVKDDERMALAAFKVIAGVDDVKDSHRRPPLRFV